MLILPKVIYRCDVISIQILAGIFFGCGNLQTDLKIHMEIDMAKNIQDSFEEQAGDFYYQKSRFITKLQ